ncbi:unnamed protein product [Durusdinium trenchii]|uniref:Uncharacterized protein n=1 Tax=Durusdinium trenchii TaxID=1381693 RepID=A0ABP0RNZ8_9DINO
MSRRRLEGSMRAGPLETPGPKVLKDEGLVYTILMCLSLREARHLWRLRRTFFKVLKDKVVPLLALAERDWSVVRVFMDSGAFRYNLDSVFTEAVLDSDFEGLRMLAERKYTFNQQDFAASDARLTSFVQKALRKGYVDKLSLLRSLRYDLDQEVQLCLAKGGVAEQLLSEGSITVDFLGSRNSFRFSMLDLATTSYAEKKIHSLCKHRIYLYKVPFVLSSFLKAGAATNAFLQVDSCGYLLLLALAAESFNFVYLLVQEAVNLQEVLARYSSELLQMVSKAMGARPGVLDLLHFCGYQLSQEQQQFDVHVLASIKSKDFATVERISKLGFDLQNFAEREQAALSPWLQQGLQDLCESDVSDEQTEGTSSTNMAGAIRSLAEIDRRVLELHFQSQVFLDYAGELMSNKEFVQMRHLVEVHPFAFKAYFEENYKAMEDLLFDAFCRRQIALIVDLTSLHLPIAPFLESHQEELDTVLQQSWFASKAWTELVMLRLEVRAFDFASFFRRTSDHIDFAVIDIIKDGYWFDLHKLAQLDFDFDQFFDRRFAEVSSAVMQFMTMPHPHFVLLRELSALRFPWDRFMEEHGSCILSSKDPEYLQFLISLGSFEVGSKVYRVVEQTCKLYHSMASSMFNSTTLVPTQDLPEDQACEAREACEAPMMGSIEAQVPEEVPQTGPAESESSSSSSKATTMARAKELARLASEKKIDAKKVMALLICRGMYCWNPLKAYADDADSDGKDSRVWSQIESVLNFLDAKDEVPQASPVQ